MSFATTDDGMNTCNQLLTMEWFGKIVICAKSETADFAFCVVCAGQRQDWCCDARQSQLAQNLVP